MGETYVRTAVNIAGLCLARMAGNAQKKEVCRKRSASHAGNGWEFLEKKKMLKVGQTPRHPPKQKKKVLRWAFAGTRGGARPLLVKVGGSLQKAPGGQTSPNPPKTSEGPKAEAGRGRRGTDSVGQRIYKNNKTLGFPKVGPGGGES